MSGTSDRARPASRRLRAIGAAGLALEALALLAAAVAYAVHAFSLPEPAFAVGLAAFCALSGAGLVPVARAVLRGRRWAVSAAVTWQAIQLLAGVNLSGISPWLGVPAAVLALVVGVAVLAGSRDALRGGP